MGTALLISAAGLGALGTPAMATPASSPAGTYKATLFAPKEKPAKVPLTLTAKGHFAFKAGPKGTWKETGTAITMTGKFEKVTIVFTVNQLGAKLGSKARPGTLTADGVQDAHWFAVPS